MCCNKYSIIPASIEPHLLPIINPSSGVNPIVVVTLLPFSKAQRDAPAPKWKAIIFLEDKSLSISFIFKDRYSYDNPWKPYLFILSCSMYFLGIA